jgi:hypothetical protein
VRKVEEIECVDIFSSKGSCVELLYSGYADTVHQMLVVRDINISIVVWCRVIFEYQEKINPWLVDVM